MIGLAALLPKIWAFPNVIPEHMDRAIREGWVPMLAISQDGVALCGHVCSGVNFGPWDMGIYTRRKHDVYQAHYPLGYHLVFLYNPRMDPEFLRVMEAMNISHNKKRRDDHEQPTGHPGGCDQTT